MVVVVLIAAGVSLFCSPSEAQLNPVDAGALLDLCERPGTDLWANCSDAANACVNSMNWIGISCDATNTAIVAMCDD